MQQILFVSISTIIKGIYIIVWMVYILLGRTIKKNENLKSLRPNLYSHSLSLYWSFAFIVKTNWSFDWFCFFFVLCIILCSFVRLVLWCGWLLLMFKLTANCWLNSFFLLAFLVQHSFFLFHTHTHAHTLSRILMIMMMKMMMI